MLPTSTIPRSNGVELQPILHGVGRHQSVTEQEGTHWNPKDPKSSGSPTQTALVSSQYQTGAEIQLAEATFSKINTRNKLIIAGCGGRYTRKLPSHFGCYKRQGEVICPLGEASPCPRLPTWLRFGGGHDQGRDSAGSHHTAAALCVSYLP